MNGLSTGDLHEQVSLHLVLLARLYRRELDAALLPFGLSEANTLPLRVLPRLGKDGVRQGVLAQALDLEGPSLIRVLGQLEGRGLIERRPCPDDGRGTVVALTAAGIALNKELGAELAAIRKRLFRGIADDDLAACLRVFASIDLNVRSPAGE